MIHYNQCPVCKSSDIQYIFKAKDYTVSNELFPVWECKSCSFRFTQDVPSQDAIGRYYQSENYISHSDTQEGLINKLYHSIRKITISSKTQLLKSVSGLSTGKVLDIGCGTGAFLHSMKQAGWEITGLEPDDTARKNAETLHQVFPLPSHELFNLEKGHYDVITMWHVLEHVHQLHEYINQCKLLLKENGALIIAVPNYTSGDANSYKEFWAAYDVPRHLYHFSPASMKTLVSQHGMKVQQMKPMWYDSFYVSMLSEQCKHGKGNNLNAGIVGLWSNVKALFNTARCSSVIYIIRKN